MSDLKVMTGTKTTHGKKITIALGNSVFKKGSVQKCPLVFGGKGEEGPCRPEQAGVAEEPERKVWAKENEDTRQSALTSDSKPSYICWCVNMPYYRARGT